MNSFVPVVLCSLLAVYSCEAAFDTYDSIAAVSALTPIPVTVTRVDSAGVLKTGDVICDLASFQAGTCSDYLNFDKKDYLQYDFTIPEGLQLAGGLTPVAITLKSCFAPFSQADRPWRKSKPEFKKDKRCSPKLKTTVPFAVGPGTVTIKIASNTPPALFAARIFIKCEGQGEHEWCYTYSAGTPTFATESMESRPTKLWVAVFVCAFIGPLLFIIQLIYERVIKKDA